MSSSPISTIRLFPATALLAVLLLGAPTAADPPAGESLTGQLLIASPDIGDPRFAHAVILMVKHDKEGAFGIIINRPFAEKSIASLLEGPGEDVSGIEGTLRVFAGCTGPNTGATTPSRSTSMWR